MRSEKVLSAHAWGVAAHTAADWRSARVDTQPEELAKMAQRGNGKRALVIGGGIAGIQAALDLANSRIPVTLVERTSSLGGRMAQLDKTFPTMDCAI
jgi:heterodisulfide reductase subunit A-like polyferredoxin